jgi:integrase
LLSAALNQAVTDRVISKNPATGTPLPQTTTPIHRYLELEEIHHLADTIDKRFSALVYTGSLAGLRPGELAALSIDNLDLTNQRLAITRTATEVAGHLSHGEPKTRASLRTIAIGSQLTDIIGRHLNTYGPGDNISYLHFPHVPDIPDGDETRTPHGTQSTGLRDTGNTPMSLTSPTVFTSPEGHPLRLGNLRRRIWKPAVRGSVGEPMRIHDLRHTAAGLAIAQGVHPRVLMERLGHRDIQTTFNVYGGLLSGYDDGIADALDEAFRASL